MLYNSSRGPPQTIAAKLQVNQTNWHVYLTEENKEPYNGVSAFQNRSNRNAKQRRLANEGCAAQTRVAPRLSSAPPRRTDAALSLSVMCRAVPSLSRSHMYVRVLPAQKLGHNFRRLGEGCRHFSPAQTCGLPATSGWSPDTLPAVFPLSEELLVVEAPPAPPAGPAPQLAAQYPTSLTSRGREGWRRG